VDVEDEQGRTALHYAASAPNPLAVTILISQGEANVVHQDNIGQIPLHTVIRRAAEVNPFERDFQKPFKDIIERLVENSGDIFQTDNESKTPWAYARGLAWIERLKDNRDMTSGPLISIPGQSLEPITPPGTLQLKACEEVRGDLVEFYTVTKAGKIQEKRNSERSYVVDMIYNLGPKTILERSRPRLKDMEVRQCRWLHLPGNNVCHISTAQVDVF
jgi:ankyrin repeat protein